MAQLAQPWRAEVEEEDKPMYKPKNALSDLVSVGVIMGATGLTLSGVQNALTRQNIGAWGVFTRTGGTIVLFGTPRLPAIAGSPEH